MLINDLMFLLPPLFLVLCVIGALGTRVFEVWDPGEGK